MNKQSKLPRFIHKMWAKLFNYFWLPCPICGRTFGGHESKQNNILWFDKGKGKGFCNDPECWKIATQKNADLNAKQKFNESLYILNNGSKL